MYALRWGKAHHRWRWLRPETIHAHELDTVVKSWLGRTDRKDTRQSFGAARRNGGSGAAAAFGAMSTIHSDGQMTESRHSTYCAPVQAPCILPCFTPFRSWRTCALVVIASASRFTVLFSPPRHHQSAVIHHYPIHMTCLLAPHTLDPFAHPMRCIACQLACPSVTVTKTRSRQIRSGSLVSAVFHQT